MRRLCLIVALAAACILCRAQEINVYDSLRSYLEVISSMPVDSINARLDALIASAGDDETRAGIAGTAYNYFLESPVMGAEGVSVYIADNYFLNKRLKWPSEATFPSLYAFAEFNRSSLLGMDAPELVLESLEGDTVNIREATSGYKVLYFYEDKCQTCTQQTPQIVALLEGYTGELPLTLYAVYTQGDRDAWARYAISNFRKIDNPKVTIRNLWDPDGTSGSHKKYSVLSTPSMLALDADNRIIGRKLNAEALAQLLGQQESFNSSLYALLDGVRDNIGLDKESIADVCAVFASRIGDDEAMYRNTYLGIYNYLRGQGEYGAMESAAFVAENYITGRPSMWSPEMLSQVGEALYRFNLNPLGSKASDATLRTRCGRQVRMLSRTGKRYTVLFFNLVSCSDCAAWKQQLLGMKELLKDSGARVISVYVGPDPKEWKQSTKGACGCWWRDLRTDWPGSDLYEKYDVATAPRLYLLDADGTVIAKDITPSTLQSILE